MLNRLTMFCIIAVLLGSALPGAQHAPKSRLDPKPYDPKVDINMDMFMSHWQESTQRHEHGTLMIRDIFTQNETGDPLKPERRGAILTHLTGYMHATLMPQNTTTPSTLDGEQKIFYIVEGKGTVTAGGERAEMYPYTGVLIPEGLEFTMKNTGSDPLRMYIVVEPTPEGFTPRKTMLVRHENDLPYQSSTGHWVNITKPLFNRKDGLAIITGMSPVSLNSMTMAQPHASLPPEVDVLWLALEGDIVTLLGKKLRRLTPGMAFANPGDGKVYHANINTTDKPIKLLWTRTVTPESVRGKYKPGPFFALDHLPYDPLKDANPDMYMGNWRDSMPQKTHGGLIERDVLTKGDPMNPPTKGAVLKYVNRFTRASLGARESTQPTTLKGEQEIIYILTGNGTVTAGGSAHELFPGIAVLVPADLEFTMKNTGDETMTMYLINEPVPSGFRPNKKLMITDENTKPWNKGNPHWTGLSKPLFNTASGLGTLENILTVQYDPMTFFQPHSHVEGCEEVWTSITDKVHVLLGKQMRYQPPGTGYLIKPNGITPHANFNVSDDRIKLFYFARYKDQEVRQ
ncbi:cupin domain-containing protein [Candidatus Latescibacterota bacterium]